VYGALALLGLVVGVYLQEGAGLSATFAGLAFLPATVISILFSSRVGAWSSRVGARPFMAAGPVVMGLGVLLYLLVRPAPDFVYWWQALPAVLVFGVGLTLTVAPLTSAILGSIDHERAGTGSAVNNAIARVAGLVLTAMVGIIVGGDLDLDGFHRAVVVTAGLFVAGGVVSLLGIRDVRTEESAAR